MITQVYSEHSHNFSYFVNVIFREIFTKKKIEFHKKSSAILALQSKRVSDFYQTVALGMITTVHDSECENFQNFFSLKEF